MTKRTIIVLIILLFGTFVSGLYGPWWAPSVFILAVSALLNLSVKQAMLTGALSLGLVFLGMTLFLHAGDEAEIISKTGNLLGGLSSGGMIGVTTFLGIMTGMLSGWIGSLLGDFFNKNGK